MDGKAFMDVMDRALNVLPPEEWPAWTEAVAHFDKGVRPTDRVTIVIERDEGAKA